MKRIFFIMAVLVFCQPAYAARELVISVLGDSLAAGFQLSARDAFPAQLEDVLRKAGHKVRVENAGVSGDTAEDGLARLEWSIGDNVDAVIVELGANDALRGHAPERVYAALDKILMRLRQRKMAVLLARMAAPRNMGAEYVSGFDAVYSRLAKKHNVILAPFFLRGIVAKRKYLLPDGLHPNAAGVAKMVVNIYPSVEKLVAVANKR